MKNLGWVAETREKNAKKHREKDPIRDVFEVRLRLTHQLVNEQCQSTRKFDRWIDELLAVRHGWRRIS